MMINKSFELIYISDISCTNLEQTKSRFYTFKKNHIFKLQILFQETNAFPRVIFWVETFFPLIKKGYLHFLVHLVHLKGTETKS